MSETTELDLTHEEAKFLWCRLKRGRDGIFNALKDYKNTGEGNNYEVAERALASVAYFFGALDTDLQTLARSAPPEVEPDGSESDKP